MFYWNPKIPNIYPNVPWVNIRKVGGDYNSGEINATGNFGNDAGFGAAVPAFSVGKGYLVSYGNVYSGITIMGSTHNFTGALNDGPISIPVDASSNKFNLIGNPYPSSIDWKASPGWTRNTLSTSGGGYDYWIWNDVSGNYGACNSLDDVGTNSTSRYIAPAQGFWVNAASTGNVNMTNEVRSHSSQTWLKSTTVASNGLRLKLTTDKSSYSDEMIVAFSSAYSDETGTLKFPSMYTEAPELWSAKSGKNYSIDRYKEMPEGLAVNIGVKAGVAGNYTLTATNIADFNLSREVMLEDLKTGTKQNLTAIPVYTFAGNPSDNQNRFKLTFSGTMLGASPAARTNEFSVYFDGNNIVVNSLSPTASAPLIEVFNVVGKQINARRLLTTSRTLIPASGLPPGAYIVRVKTNSGVTTTKVIIY